MRKSWLRNYWVAHGTVLKSWAFSTEVWPLTLKASLIDFLSICTDEPGERWDMRLTRSVSPYLPVQPDGAWSTKTLQGNYAKHLYTTTNYNKPGNIEVFWFLSNNALRNLLLYVGRELLHENQIVIDYVTEKNTMNNCDSGTSGNKKFVNQRYWSSVKQILLFSAICGVPPAVIFKNKHGTYANTRRPVLALFDYDLWDWAGI